MKRDFADISEKTFDLIVVGGGIIGACIARDAAMRGLKTLLLEKDDFAAGTTSRSTRLIHGGFRYLQHFEFGLVREDLREREILLKIAPHLVHPLPFLIPITTPIDHLIMAMGTLLYDILSYDKSVPGRKHYSRETTMKMEPNMKLAICIGMVLSLACWKRPEEKKLLLFRQRVLPQMVFTLIWLLPWMEMKSVRRLLPVRVGRIITLR